MKEMKRHNEQDDGVKGRKKMFSPDGIGDYVRDHVSLCAIPVFHLP